MDRNPWTRSAGPKSTEAKAKVARNAFKGALRPTLRLAVRSLKDAIAIQGRFLDALDLQNDLRIRRENHPACFLGFRYPTQP
jgi:hypothetical protein